MCVYVANDLQRFECEKRREKKERVSVVKSNRFGRAKGEVEEQRRKRQVEVPKRRRRIPAHKKKKTKEKKAPYFISCVIVTSILSWPDGSQRIRFERVGVALRLTKRRRTRLLSYLVGSRSTSLHERKKPPPKKKRSTLFFS